MVETHLEERNEDPRGRRCVSDRNSIESRSPDADAAQFLPTIGGERMPGAYAITLSLFSDLAHQVARFQKFHRRRPNFAEVAARRHERFEIHVCVVRDEGAIPSASNFCPPECCKLTAAGWFTACCIAIHAVRVECTVRPQECLQEGHGVVHCLV